MAIDFKPLHEYIKYGLIADCAKKNKLQYRRAYRLIYGELKNPKPSDMSFINDIITAAKKQKDLVDPVNSRIKNTIAA